MNWADWLICGVIGLSCLLGLSRGFIREAMSLAVWVAAIVVAFFFSEALATRMVDTIDTPSLRQMAAFAGLFVVTMILGSMVSKLVGQLVDSAGMKGFDRFLGAGFGFARGVIIMLVALVFIPNIIDVRQDPWWQESKLIPEVLSLEEMGRSLAAQGMELFGKELEEVRGE